MAGYSIYPSIDLEVEGKYGKYRVRKEIGKGGNGAVFAVDIDYYLTPRNITSLLERTEIKYKI